MLEILKIDLSDAGKLGDITDIMSAMSIAGLIFYFLIPTFTILLVIFGIRRLIKNNKRKHSNKVVTDINNESNTKNITDIQSEYKNIQKSNKKINNNKIYDTFLASDIKFQDHDPNGVLTLNFNKDGKIINQRRN